MLVNQLGESLKATFSAFASTHSSTGGNNSIFRTLVETEAATASQQKLLEVVILMKAKESVTKAHIGKLTGERNVYRGLRSSDITVMAIHTGRGLQCPGTQQALICLWLSLRFVASLMKRLTVNCLLELWGCVSMRKELFAMVQRLLGSRHVRQPVTELAWRALGPRFNR